MKGREKVERMQNRERERKRERERERERKGIKYNIFGLQSNEQ